MNENKSLQIKARLDEINRIESFIESFCLKYRIYDEYFGIIMHSLSEVLRKIVKQNNDPESRVDISQLNEKSKVVYYLSSPDNLDLKLTLNQKNATDTALSKLIDEMEVEDNQIAITYNIQSIHYNEWIRRKNLLENYNLKSQKKAR
ncbi:MAG: hypothetical protein K9I47_08130 [Bacteroidales bacterium]|nr:hypothetical protein [Bacteroidales bacterium]